MSGLTMAQKLDLSAGCEDCKIEKKNGVNLVTFCEFHILGHEVYKEKMAQKSVEQEQEECEHDFDPDEGYHCLHCDLDGSEDIIAMAYDRAKDARKYGGE